MDGSTEQLICSKVSALHQVSGDKFYLHELLTTLQKKGKKQVRFQNSKKVAKKRKVSQESSDSENSVHEMDVTPEPSDDEADKAERIQAFITEELTNQSD